MEPFALLYKDTCKKKHNNVFILRDMGVGDMICTIGLLEYLSTIYDEVRTTCRVEFLKYFNMFHKENPKIKPFVYKKEFLKPYGWAFPDEILEELSKTYDIRRVGNYYKTYEAYNEKIYDYPKSYYDNCKLPHSYAKDYLNIVIPQNIIDMYDELFTNHKKYIVTHQESSTCSPNLIKKQNIDINKILVIDVNKNLYDTSHKYYDIANKFVNLANPLWYKLLLEHAYVICVIDSMIYALTMCLDISNVHTKICYHRAPPKFLGNNGYTYIQLLCKKDSRNNSRYSFADESLYLIYDPHI